MTSARARTWPTCFAASEALFHSKNLLNPRIFRIAGSPDYPVTSENAILALASRRPDPPRRALPFRERDAAFWRERLPSSCRVVLVSGDDFCWHGARTLRGIAAAGQLARQVREPVSAGPRA